MLLVAAALLAALAAAAAARAETPGGIVRPDDESQLSQVELGRQLFAGNCATCHGSRGEGITVPAKQRGTGDTAGMGPSLRGVGKLSPDFYLRRGYMPLSSPFDQPEPSRVLFHEREIQALVQYIDSLGGGPPIPSPDAAAGSIAQGQRLFTEHCAGCHQVAAEGGVAPGARVPPLKDVNPTQIAQAVRIGPYVMPKFSERSISDDELNSIIAYVESVRSPDDPGGWGIGHIGPVPEGLVAWLIGALAAVAVCVVIGKRARA
jgi:ubiquinol-cytochrome c reductase cytochrome c subunit